MSIVKKIVVDSLATHPGFLKMQMLNDDGTVACESLMNVAMAHDIMRQMQEHVSIAQKLAEHLHTVIARDSFDGKYGPDMKVWADRGGYEYNNKKIGM